MPFGPLVDAASLSALRDDVVLVDVRWKLLTGPERDAYERAHLPGAVFADLDADLSRRPLPGEGRHPLPAPEAFAAAMGALGIDGSQPVVAYDDAGGAFASRLWWMLHVLDVPAAVLDGGLAAWDGPLESGPSSPVPVAPMSERPWPPSATADLAEIEAHAHASVDRRFTLLDARAAARYRGEVDVDPCPGHIPGARSRDFAGNLDADGRFRSPAELRSRYDDLGPDVVVSCGSGVTACHDALAMVVAGLPLPRVFVGSYSQWLADDDRPVATGPDPG